MVVDTAIEAGQLNFIKRRYRYASPTCWRGKMLENKVEVQECKRIWGDSGAGSDVKIGK